jgi:hypothetical protein
MAIQRLSDVKLTSLTAGREFQKSPAEWEDHVFYFLLVDRFSDGNENSFRVRRAVPGRFNKSLDASQQDSFHSGEDAQT